MQAEIEKIDTEIRVMFEQLMDKDGKNQGATSVDSSHGKKVDSFSLSKVVSPSLNVEIVDLTTKGSTRFCKHGRL